MASIQTLHQIGVIRLAPVVVKLIHTDVNSICIRRTHISPKCLLASWYTAWFKKMNSVS